MKYHAYPHDNKQVIHEMIFMILPLNFYMDDSRQAIHKGSSNTFDQKVKKQIRTLIFYKI